LELTFDEIKDDREFEDLTASLLESLSKVKKNITEITVLPSGVGADGGRDILVKLSIHDGLYHFDRRWIIQCKFHNKAISTSDIADINIPSLIHSYNAHGYLLACRVKPTSKLTSFIENLDKECKFKYKYRVIYGNALLGMIRDHPLLIEHYFPKYHKYISKYKTK